MIKLLKAFLVVFTGIFVLSSTSQALIFKLDEFTGDPSDVWVTVLQNSGDLRFSVTQPGPDPVGDLRGLFFHVRDEAILPDLDFTFVSYSGTGSYAGPLVSIVNANMVTSVGQANINGGGLGKYDVGVEFGSQGMGSDFIESIIFDVSAPAPLDLNDFFPLDMYSPVGMAARVMSLPTGSPPSGNNGSSKLGCCGDTPGIPSVPEPSAFSLVALGVFLLGLNRRRSGGA